MRRWWERISGLIVGIVVVVLLGLALNWDGDDVPVIDVDDVDLTDCDAMRDAVSAMRDRFELAQLESAMLDAEC